MTFFPTSKRQLQCSMCVYTGDAQEKHLKCQNRIDDKALVKRELVGGLCGQTALSKIVTHVCETDDKKCS